MVLLGFNWQVLATEYSSCTKKPIFTLSTDYWKTDCSLSLNAFVSCNACTSLPVFLLLITTLYPQFNSVILYFHAVPLSTHQCCLCARLSPSLIFLQGFERNVTGISTLKITVHPRSLYSMDCFIPYLRCRFISTVASQQEGPGFKTC